MTQSTVGQLIVEQIRAEGVSHAFCVPGESYLGILDAFFEMTDLSLVVTHHEEGAGFMADAMSKANGAPGVALVSRAPGLAHLAIALHAARQDATPLVAIVGQVESVDMGRDSFQEVDVLSLGRIVAKASFEVRSPDKAAEVIARAFFIARSGRPGPVVVSIPEEVANASTESVPTARRKIPVPAPLPADVARAASVLRSSTSVAMVVGAGVLQAKATGAAVELAERLGATVYTAWRRFDAFPNSHHLYAGNLPWLPPDLQAPLLGADVVLTLGTRLGDFTSLGYRVPTADQKLVQMDLTAEAMSVVRAPDVGILGDCQDSIHELLDALANQSPPRDRLKAAEAAHDVYVRASTPATSSKRQYVDLEVAMGILRRVLPASGATDLRRGGLLCIPELVFPGRSPERSLGRPRGRWDTPCQPR